MEHKLCNFILATDKKDKKAGKGKTAAKKEEKKEEKKSKKKGKDDSDDDKKKGKKVCAFYLSLSSCVFARMLDTQRPILPSIDEIRRKRRKNRRKIRRNPRMTVMVGTRITSKRPCSGRKERTNMEWIRMMTRRLPLLRKLVWTIQVL
jgi:hypothetical protein